MKLWPFSKQKRSYDAAAGSRLLAGFRGTNSSEDTTLRMDLPTLRQRSRDLARNNDYYKNALRIIASNVVGCGIPFQSQIKKQRGGKLDKDLNDAIENLWWDWTKAENCHLSGKYSFQQIEQIIMKSVPKNGETFIRLVRTRAGRSRIPLALQLIEADLLDETFNDKTADGNEIRMGVERNADGRPVAYHFFEKHPGDYAAFAPFTDKKRVRIPAKEIIHLFLPEDENQTRAAPWAVSGMKRLHHVQGYEEATVVGHRTRSSIMGFIETPEGQLEGDTAEGGDQLYDFEPAQFRKLPKGSTMNVPNLGGDTGDFEPFMKTMLRGAACGFGMSYETFSKDYQGATYSSARQALLEDRDVWRMLQWWLIRSFHEKVLEAFLDGVYLSNTIDLPLYASRPEIYLNVKWQPRGWTWIDPEKEVNAYTKAVRSGFKTVSDIITENGGDVDEYADTRRRELDLFKENKIVLDTDPEQVTATGQAQNEPSSQKPAPKATAPAN